MSDPPVTLSVLAQFHRDVILPDMQRVVRDAVEDLRVEFSGHFDALYRRLDRLETEYQMLVAGMRRIEDRLDRVEGRLEQVEGRLERVETRLDGVEKQLQGLTEAQQKMALKADLETLKSRVDVLQQQIRSIEARLAG
jgi:chromosome segregation ATPase